ncbi:MAG: 4-(cytidine 5'-diphospho)-2-C-methyl-D-erythritol kinase [Candidatus Binataceae bacterium]
MVKLLAEPAPAKINLFLRVVGRRADGYHELDSVFVPVSLCDQVRVEIRVGPRSATDTAIALGCDREDIPTEKNLAWRAADAFLCEFGAAIHRPHQVAIDLRKKIPAGAGLGGGSSDAGAVLRMMTALCRVNEAPRLTRVALAIGADVPFFLSPRPAHVGGVGERIAPLELMAPGERAPFRQTPLWMVIAVPPIEVSTAKVFRALLPEQWSGAASAEHLRAIASGQITPAMLQNDLAAVAMARYPEIARLRSALIAAGAEGASMSGSGSAVFGIFPGADVADQAAAQLRHSIPQARYYVVNSFI